MTFNHLELPAGRDCLLERYSDPETPELQRADLRKCLKIRAKEVKAAIQRILWEVEYLKGVPGVRGAGAGMPGGWRLPPRADLGPLGEMRPSCKSIKLRATKRPSSNCRSVSFNTGRQKVVSKCANFRKVS